MLYFCEMHLFRIKWLRLSFILLTGVIFLNSSFFMAEVSALKINKNKALIENIKRLISSSTTEEEKDCAENQEGESVLKEITCFINLIGHRHSFLNLVSTLVGLQLHNLVPLQGHIEIITPPPDYVFHIA